MPTIEVLDSNMFYEEEGTGTPFVFLHGNPTSSYLWRQVLPGIGEPARCLAPDLIGMGRSGKPDLPYRFADHARYLDGWFDALALDGVVLVGIDWGGSLAFDWAARQPGRTRAVAFMETIVRPMRWAEFVGDARPRLEALRAPGIGEVKVLDENFFIEKALRATVLSGLSEEDLDVYRSPYPTRDSRRPLLEWPRSWPVDGEPVDVARRMEAYDEWLADSQDVPKLLLTFDGPPEVLDGSGDDCLVRRQRRQSGDRELWTGGSHGSRRPARTDRGGDRRLGGSPPAPLGGVGNSLAPTKGTDKCPPPQRLPRSTPPSSARPKRPSTPSWTVTWLGPV
jgi:haloalkane dehalogenase